MSGLPPGVPGGGMTSSGAHEYQCPLSEVALSRLYSRQREEQRCRYRDRERLPLAESSSLSLLVTQRGAIRSGPLRATAEPLKRSCIALPGTALSSPSVDYCGDGGGATGVPSDGGGVTIT